MVDIFAQIIRRELPAHIVLEDDQFIAFLDIHPLVMGHVLLVPKREIDYIFDHDDPTLSALMLHAKKIASATRKAIPCKRIGIAVVGFEVPHAHMHLVPLNSMEDINFSNTKLNPSEEELDAVQKKIVEKM